MTLSNNTFYGRSRSFIEVLTKVMSGIEQYKSIQTHTFLCFLIIFSNIGMSTNNDSLINESIEAPAITNYS